MGDRYYSYEKCPKCGETYELYDAPSSLMYVGICDNCGWSESKDYYELDLHTVALYTPKELAAWEKKNGRKVLNRMSDKELMAYMAANE